MFQVKFEIRLDGVHWKKQVISSFAPGWYKHRAELIDNFDKKFLCGEAEFYLVDYNKT